MRRRLTRAPSPIVRAVVVAAAATLLLVAVAAGVLAQTLTDPYPQTKLRPPPVAAKSRPTARVKSCRSYGDGFVKIPGTDACVKIGGWATMESTGRH
jgi:Porin subfamily